MKAGTNKLIKYMALRSRLGLRDYATRGILDALWDATRTNTPAGNIGKYTNAQIAVAIDWEGDPDELIKAFVECGWIDVDKDYRLVIHDWADHCEDAVHMKMARSKMLFCDGSKPKVARLPKHEREELERFFHQPIEEPEPAEIPKEAPKEESCADVVRTESAQMQISAAPPSLPFPPLPSPTLHKETSAPNVAVAAPDPPKSGGVEEDFDEFYAMYPRKRDPADAKRRYITVRKSGVSHERIMDGLRRDMPTLKAMIASNAAGRGPSCKHPATWLNKGSYDSKDDEAQKPVESRPPVFLDADGNQSFALQVLHNRGHHEVAPHDD